MSSRKQDRMTSATANSCLRHACYWVMLAAIACVGCVSGRTAGSANISMMAAGKSFLNKPPRLRRMYAKAQAEGNRNFVLNHMHIGIAAMELREFELAEQSFDKALTGIETCYANNPAAAKARSLYYEEGSKDFKGEPYERTMAYYYRGLLYLRKGDLENARACFMSGVMQDAFAEEEQNRCDFALMFFLEGWCSQRLGNQQLADMAFKKTKRLRPDFIRPDSTHNTLIVVETGKSPRKVADGVGHYELKYRRGRAFSEKSASVTIGGNGCRAYPMEDIFLQASTRGGRQIDKILKGQVIWRRTHEASGTALTDVSENVMIFGNSDGLQGAGAVLGLIGIMQMQSAAAARPRADTRYWSNLPDAVHIVTCRSAQPAPTVTVSFHDGSGSPVLSSKTGQIDFTKGNSALAWIRSRSAL